MIYFIATNELDKVKIGFSKDINGVVKRWGIFQKGSPSLLICIGLIEGTQNEEYVIHRKFNIYRSHYEWFTLSNEIISFIKKISQPDLLNQLVESISKSNKRIVFKDRTKPINVIKRGEDISPELHIWIKKMRKLIDSIHPNENKQLTLFRS